MKAEKVLSKYFCDLYGIDYEKECDIEWVSARSLLVPNRLDIIAKMIWIQAVDTGENISFADEIYEQSIRAITCGTCVENGKEDEKGNLNQFKIVFKQLFAEIKKNGFDEAKSVIPVGDNSTIMDGAHRIAIAAYLDIKVPIVRLNGLTANIGVNELASCYMDYDLAEYLLTRYLEITSENIYAIILWPKANPALRDVAGDVILKNFSLCYKKEMMLDELAIHNIILQIYNNFEWIGSYENHFAGAKLKTNAVFEKSNSTIVYFVRGPELETVRLIKEEIREIFDEGKESIHITDTATEAIQVAHILLNRNSFDLIKRGTPQKSAKLNKLIDVFKKAIIDSGNSLDDYIIDSSAVMGLYGIRDVSDMDYLCRKEYIDDNLSEEIDFHGDYLRYYNSSLTELLYIPSNYLYYNEVKFISLKVLTQFKEARKEKKDIADLNLISSFEKHSFSINDCLFIFKYTLGKKYNVYKNEFHIWVGKHEKLHSLLRNIKNIVVRR